MASSRIHFEPGAPHIARLTFDRPDRLNALDREAVEALYHVLGSIGHDTALRAVVITGRGRAFSAGLDLKEMDVNDQGLGTGLEARDRLQLFQDLTRLMVSSPAVFIAAINGMAAGVGAEVALACDIRIGSEAAEVMFAEVKRGLFETNGVMHYLPRVVGHGRATQWLLTGERVAAAALLQAGFITELLPAERLLDRADELAALIAGNAPIPVRFVKQLMRRTWETDLETMLQLEVNGVVTTMASEDRHEGLRAFLEKRTPQWKGR